MVKKRRKSAKGGSAKRSGRGALSKEDNAMIDVTIEKIVALMDQAETCADYERLLEHHFPRSSECDDFDPLEMQLETPRFLATGFRIEKATKKTKHRLGGSPVPKTPDCAACENPLILFAEFDGSDKLFGGNLPVNRLPLYYCCSCPGPIFYQVGNNGKIKVLRSTREPYEEAPFENPPKALAPAYLSLRPIDAEEEEAVFAAHRKAGFDALGETQVAAISRVLGRKAKERWDVYFSQLGGLPLSYQGEEGKPSVCPNKGCRFRRRKRAEFAFRPLAVLDLWNDRFWGLKPLDAVQIVYHICPGCFCISAKYTCT